VRGSGGGYIRGYLYGYVVKGMRVGYQDTYMLDIPIDFAYGMG
jgi:hypothetical protein